MNHHENPSTQASYREHARLYDKIYHWKDYPAEARALRAILDEAGVPPGSRILEAACGTGEHLRQLRDTYRVKGFDLNPGILAVARDKLAGIPLWRADMADFRVSEPFDALLCLFSSIGYVYPEQRLRAAAAAFAAAVRPGGALVVEPWITPDVFRTGQTTLHTYESDDLKLARGTAGRIEGELSVFDFHWLVLRAGAPVEHFVDRHALWLAPTDTLLSAFTEAGFDCRFEPDGLMPERGLILGRRI